MKAGYRNLSVKFVSYREYDLGGYVRKYVFTLDGRKAAVYEEPKEMSCYNENYCDFPPKCTITYSSEKARAEIESLVEQYRKDRPAAARGRFANSGSVEDMMSQLAWTAEMIKASEEFIHHYEIIYTESTGLRHENSLDAFYMRDEDDEKVCLHRQEKFMHIQTLMETIL